MGLTMWRFCDDLDTPELCVCASMEWWDKNKYEVMEWFEKEGKGVGAVISDHMLFIYPNQHTLFLLRFGL